MLKLVSIVLLAKFVDYSRGHVVVFLAVFALRVRILAVLALLLLGLVVVVVVFSKSSSIIAVAVS